MIPELNEMRDAHIVSIGSESLASLNPDCYDGFVSLPLFLFPQDVSLPSHRVLCEIGIEFSKTDYPSNDSNEYYYHS